MTADEKSGRIGQKLKSLFGSCPLNDRNADLKRRMRLLNMFCIILMLFSVLMIVVNLLQGQMRFVILVVALFIASGLSIALNSITGRVFLSTILILVALNAFALYLIHSGGVEGNGYLWLFPLPILELFAFGNRTGLISIIVLLIISLILLFFPENALLVHAWSTSFKIRFLVAFSGLTVFSAVAEHSRKVVYQRLQDKNRELEDALQKVKVLRGLIPICSSCKKIRDDKGYWSEVEVYIRDHSDLDFSHGLCPDCLKKLYPDEK